MVLYQISFPKEDFIKDGINGSLRQIPRILMIFFFLRWVFGEFLSDSKGIFHKKHSIEILVAILLWAFNTFKNKSEILSSDYFLFLLITSLFFIQVMEVSAKIKNSLLTPPVLFAISFILVIFWGTAMLLIPNATNGKLHFIDAIFLATSSVCVTGLSSVDISTKLTPLGTNIFLILIQIGGLGLMTFTNFFAVLFRGGTSLRTQLIVSDIVASNEPGSLFSILKRILLYTFTMELLGASLIYLMTHDTSGLGGTNGWFFSWFHSISAFCNAGFSNVSGGLYNQLLRYNYPLLIVIAGLVIFGGLGYPVVNDLIHAFKYYFKGVLRYLFLKEKLIRKTRLLSVHTKIVLTTTGLLLFMGTLVFYFLEHNNVLAEHTTTSGKWILSFYQSAIPRTAGCDAVNLGNISQGTILLAMLLMWIGGAPNSTAGGIKVTTFALGFLSAASLAKGRERIEVFKREITLRSIQRSYVVIFLSFIIIGLGVFLMTIFEPNVPLQMIVFECFSAYGTVGSSLNLTPELSNGSKWVLIFLMFSGRVGLFTLLFGLFSKDRSDTYKYPHESVQVL